MALDADIAYIIGFACEAVLWGAYSILFFVASTVLVSRRGKRDLNVVLVIANCTLYVLATTHFAIEFNHYYTYLQSMGVAGYANETMPLLGADTIMSLLDFVGDMVMIYRCWLVWGKNWYVIILPSLSALAGFACIMEVAHLIDTLDPTAPSPPAAIVPLGLSGYILPLCTNIMVTILISTRVWFYARGSYSNNLVNSKRVTRQAIAIVIESGLLYTAVQLVYVVLFSMSHPAEQIVGIMAVQIYGIAPTLIIIRVGLGLSDDYASYVDMTPMAWASSRSKPAHNSGYGISTTRVTVSSSTGITPDDIHLKNDVEMAVQKSSEYDASSVKTGSLRAT